jgi:MFS superfamily sulfate permease-like transporter
MSYYYSVSNTLTTGAIIAIVVGSVVGLAILIGVIIAIVCVIKQINRSNNIRRQGMIVQPAPPYPQSWPNQYPPNTTSIANYPPSAPPYTASAPSYATPNYM